MSDTFPTLEKVEDRTLTPQEALILREALLGCLFMVALHARIGCDWYPEEQLLGRVNARIRLETFGEKFPYRHAPLQMRSGASCNPPAPVDEATREFWTPLLRGVRGFR